MTNLSRRGFFAATGAASLSLANAMAKDIPVGLEMYSVRDELAKDIPGHGPRRRRYGLSRPRILRALLQLGPPIRPAKPGS